MDKLPPPTPLPPTLTLPIPEDHTLPAILRTIQHHWRIQETYKHKALYHEQNTKLLQAQIAKEKKINERALKWNAMLENALREARGHPPINQQQGEQGQTSYTTGGEHRSPSQERIDREITKRLDEIRKDAQRSKDKGDAAATEGSIEGETIVQTTQRVIKQCLDELDKVENVPAALNLPPMPTFPFNPLLEHIIPQQPSSMQSPPPSIPQQPAQPIPIPHTKKEIFVPTKQGYRKEDTARGLDELQELDLSVGEVDELTSETLPKSWKTRQSLRGHLDVVRAVYFHPTLPCLFSASDDGTIKMWDLEAKSKKGGDIEPTFTYRGHDKAVTCITCFETSSSIYLASGGIDGTVRTWHFVDRSRDTWGPYDPSKLSHNVYIGHTDAVWSLASLAKSLLVSASADGSVRAWDVNGLQSVWRIATDGVVPTALCTWDQTVGVGRSDGAVSILVDFKETDLLQWEPTAPEDASNPYRRNCNALVKHPSQAILIGAFEDKHLRLFDLGTMRCEHSMIAHLDSVASLDFSPSGTTLISGGHDCSVRLWDLGLPRGSVDGITLDSSGFEFSSSSTKCIQEFTAHRKKYDEGVLSVAFYRQPWKGLEVAASSGADGIVKLVSCEV